MHRMITGWGLLLLLLLGSPGCRSQEKPPSTPRVDRKPAAAGGFYPADSAELKATLKDLFAKAKPASVKNVVAVICPHAGYQFSGVVAASSINQVDPNKQFDNVFVIGSSHHVYFMGASVYNQGDYVTPLGKVPVNIELADQLIRDNPVFSYRPDADLNEHCVEVEVPFLQYYLKKPFRLVPVVLGTQSDQTCKKIAAALKPYFNGKNLFVFSTDFSHYPSYEDAKKVDKKTCDAVLTKSADNLMAVLKSNANDNIPNLATSMCGWTSILTLMYLVGNDPTKSMVPVYYLNSGDSPAGDKSQVVGYWSIAVTENDKTTSSSEFNFTMDEKKELLKIARETIEKYIRDQKVPAIDATNFTDNLKMQAGAFVTLKENGELRGCIGRFTSDEPLYKLIQEMAVASSTEDTRFSPVTAAEIPKLRIEISVLSPMKKISSPDEIELGKHGIYIKKGYFGGTFLPQVATETGWTKEEFLGHCARDKAGIGWDGWKTADIYIYEAAVFSEEEVNARKE
ncbi:MAG TPA: AmmeMemoRadiSam system protein B [Bacteroidales bacterium]|nr:AmmeMemoRadiSam system protein B [Bacteroidales bacterium]